jgi:chemosensory pili system protein ChpC
MQNTPQKDIRGVLITVTNNRILLPNATVSEVITFANPEPYLNQPRWVFGRIRWRGWQIPLISFALLTGSANQEGQIGARVAVLKALGGHSKLPYFAILTQGFPRLTTVTLESLIPDSHAGNLPAGVLMPVMIKDDHAVIPDLGVIEQLIVDSVIEPLQVA